MKCFYCISKSLFFKITYYKLSILIIIIIKYKHLWQNIIYLFIIFIIFVILQYFYYLICYFFCRFHIFCSIFFLKICMNGKFIKVLMITFIEIKKKGTYCITSVTILPN